jgi:hypothetical protein
MGRLDETGFRAALVNRRSLLWDLKRYKDALASFDVALTMRRSRICCGRGRLDRS